MSTTRTATTSADARHARGPAAPLHRLMTSPQAAGWIVSCLMALFGGLLRFIRLGSPRSLVFDETYYVKDAWTMLNTGEPRDWPETIAGIKIDTLFADGKDLNGWLNTAEYVVHPPFGKWCIALGLKLFGGAQNPFAWRVAAAVAGTVAIVILCRIILRLFHSLPMVAIGGFLMSIDGMGIVLSRTGLLDNFIMVFALGAFACMLAHRDWARQRLQNAYQRESTHRGARWIAVTGRNGSIRWQLDATGPFIACSWWRLAAAILLGLTTGVKWSGAYFFAVFCVISVLWDAWERHRVGFRSWLTTGIWRDAVPAALYMIPVYALTYGATWLGWFLHKDSYMRDWASQHPGEGITWLPESMRSFVQYHIQMWQFHTTLDSLHDYQANPLTWPIQQRPTSFYWNELGSTEHPGLCALQKNAQCVEAVTSLGNPLIWWLGSACVIIGIVIAIAVKHGDWKIWAVLAGFLGGWLPWAQYLHRTTFTFYAIVILPWVILGFIYVADWLHGVLETSTYWWIMGGVLTIIGLVSAFFYPIWTAMPVPYPFWLSHMWFDSWI